MPSIPPPDPPPAAAPAADNPDWPLWIAPAAVGTGLALGVVLSSLVALVGHAAGSSLSNPTPAVNIAGDFVFDLGFVGTAIYFAALRGRPRPRDFGYKRVSPALAAGVVLAAGVGYYVLSAVYGSLLSLHGSDKLPSELGVGKSTAALIAAGVFVCVVAPICEEFFFRGFLFGVLRRWRITVGGRELGPWVAAVITGILFGLAHTGSASAQYLVPLGFLGFVLCLVRWRTGSLYPCMALHSINNSLALGINQLSWNAVEILLLIVGSLAVIGILTGPLSRTDLKAGHA
jgi:membrane protease YdiL (CAAX protease family)